MSRNDQVTRQWFILQALERPGGATIEEIARTLPKDYACHLRTIRRDLQALEVRFDRKTSAWAKDRIWHRTVVLSSDKKARRRTFHGEYGPHPVA